MTDFPERSQHLHVGTLGRHRHRSAYATIVLDGSYLERGLSGCWLIEPGHVVAHVAFDSHCNHVSHHNTRVLNFAVPPGLALPPVFTVADADALISAVNNRPADVAELLHPTQILTARQVDWPDQLASALAARPLSITSWARASGLAPETVSRGFHAAYGVTPARFRREAQTIRALQRLSAGPDPAAAVAADCGFADQAHLCRAVKGLTGHTPEQWRRIKSVQDPKAPPP